MELAETRTVGRAEVEVSAAVARELTHADLMALEAEAGLKPKPLKNLRESHHALARAIATGLRPGEAAAVIGYSQSRVSILLADPTFQELVAEKRALADGHFAEYGLPEHMQMASLDATKILQERLEEAPETFTHGQLLEITKAFADRTGHGPQTKSTQVSVNVNLAGRLSEARRRAGLLLEAPASSPQPMPEARPQPRLEAAE